MGVKQYLNAILRGSSAETVKRTMKPQDIEILAGFVQENKAMLPRRLRRKALRDMMRRT